MELNSIETYAPNFLDIMGGPLKLQLLGVSWGLSEAATLMVHPLIIYFKVMCWQYMYMSSASHFIPKHIFCIKMIDIYAKFIDLAFFGNLKVTSERSLKKLK